MADNGSIDHIFRDRTLLDEAMRRTAREVQRRHKLLGRPLVVWQDGKVVKIPPEEIVVEETDDRAA
jgi:hypothetical protein